MRVPEHLLPETMVEWGEIPPGFETLCSESISDSTLKRNVLQVYPEVGCGCDNLPTTTTMTSFPLVNSPSNKPLATLTGTTVFDSKLPPLAQAPNEVRRSEATSEGSELPDDCCSIQSLTTLLLASLLAPLIAACHLSEHLLQYQWTQGSGAFVCISAS